MPLGGNTETLGSHKGYGYGMLCEIFCSILSMGTTSNYAMHGGRSGICHGFIAINPASFGDPEAIKEHWQEIRDIIAQIPTYEQLLELYTKIGAKHTLSELGIDESVKDEFLDISSAIRNRLTLARMTRLIVR